MNRLLSDRILPLSVPEKLQLIEDIWNSIAIDTDRVPVTPAQKQELDRRLASDRDIEERGESWEVVKRRIMKNDL